MVGGDQGSGDRGHRYPGLFDGPLGFEHFAHQRCSGAITRLVDMEIEPFLIASSVEMVIARDSSGGSAKSVLLPPQCLKATF